MILIATLAGLFIQGRDVETAGGPISYGDRVRWRLSDASPALETGHVYELYTFQGRAGDSVEIALESTEFDTFVRLYGAAGVLGENDDIDASTRNSRLAAALSADGEYRIQVSSYDPGGRGAYVLSLRREEVAQGPRRLAYGDEVQDRLTAGDPLLANGQHYRQYVFPAAAGDLVEATLESAEFDPWLAVQSLDGQALASNDDVDSSNRNSRVVWTVPSGGDYGILVTAYTVGATGSYTLRLRRVDAPAVGNRIEIGGEVRGSLGEDDPQLNTGHRYEFWSFRGRAGDEVEITLASATFDAWVRLYNGSVSVGENDNAGEGTTDSRLVLRLSEDGEYAILVTARGVDQGGAFTLRLGGGQGAPPPGPFVPDLADFAVEAESAEVVRAAEGGSVALPDGARVEIPAGALPADGRVTLRRLTNPGPEGRMMTLFDVDAGGARLASEATLTLPCPPADPVFDDFAREYKVIHVHVGEIREIPSRYDPERNVVEVRAQEFSLLGVILAILLGGRIIIGDFNPIAVVERWARDNPVDPPLTVPYYGQSSANWCWAACTSMLLKTYGRDTEIWELARDANLPFLNSLNDPRAYWTGGLKGIFEHEGLVPDVSRFGWWGPVSATMYVMNQLRAGHPVYVCVSGIQHAVVAVGFNQGGIYFHDPSGHLLVMANNLGFASIPAWGDFVQAGRLGAFYLPWSAWINVCRQGLGLVYTASVTGGRRGAGPVSIQIFPDELSFEHPKPAPMPATPAWRATFTWDGTVGYGYRFVPSVQTMYPPYATNSDRLILKVRASNASPSAVSVQLRAYVDGPHGAELIPPQNVMVPPGTAGGPPFACLAPIDVGPTAGTQFPAAGFTPGRYLMIVEATSGSTLLDSVPVWIDIGPGKVYGVRFETRDGQKLLRWDYSVGGDIYVVKRVAGQFSSAPVELGRTESNEWPLGRNEPAPPVWYFIDVLDRETGLQGPPSDYLSAGRAPEVTIESPASGAELTETTVEVTGTCRGTKDGTPNGQPIDRITILVNGTEFPTNVADERFTQRVLLSRGENTIVARAENPGGRAEASVRVQANIEATILKIVMSWDGDGNDVDLHVTDPESRITGFDDPIRPGSRVDGRQLDIDDTSGPGVETYTMTRELSGTYQVRVNYYRGDQPQGFTLSWILYEGQPYEQRNSVTGRVLVEDRNRGESGANATVPIVVPPRP